MHRLPAVIKCHIMLAILGLIACNEEPSPGDKAGSRVPASAIQKHIQLFPAGDTMAEFHRMRERIAELNLNSLEGGAKSLQIRIWYEHETLWIKEVVHFKKKKHSWSGQHITVRTDHRSDGSEIITSRKMKRITPKSGWDRFLAQLEAQRFFTLPGWIGAGADGVTYAVEIADSSQYRFFCYWSPETDLERSNGSQQMAKVLELIQSEFGLKDPYPK